MPVFRAGMTVLISRGSRVVRMGGAEVAVAMVNKAENDVRVGASLVSIARSYLASAGPKIAADPVVGTGAPQYRGRFG